MPEKSTLPLSNITFLFYRKSHSKSCPYANRPLHASTTVLFAYSDGLRTVTYFTYFVSQAQESICPPQAGQISSIQPQWCSAPGITPQHTQFPSAGPYPSRAEPYLILWYGSPSADIWDTSQRGFPGYSLPQAGQIFLFSVFFSFFFRFNPNIAPSPSSTGSNLAMPANCHFLLTQPLSRT